MHEELEILSVARNRRFREEDCIAELEFNGACAEEIAG
jgi:hypothetical protein